ncbi:MAG: hypothetical protein HYR84_10040 [Planctomycetes bacterium]|nr:hypothetical protein [Planctomycetota bacterium]
MSRQWMAVVAVCAMLAWGNVLAANAKPADLPGQNGIECPDGVDDPVAPPGANAAPDAPMLIDPFLPAFVEQTLQHLSDAWTRPDRAVDLGSILNRFAPSWMTSLGRGFLNDENRRDTSEEQGGRDDAANPEQAFREMRERTVPLGLVEVSY